MSWTTYWVILGVCAGSILIFRILPYTLLSGRTLPRGIQAGLDFVPVAAFTALVANDLFSPARIAAGLWPTMLPLLAALPVVIVAIKTRSLVACVVVGVVVFAVLSMII